MDNLNTFTKYLASKCERYECPVYGSVRHTCPFEELCDEVTPQMWEDWLLEVDDDEE